MDRLTPREKEVAEMVAWGAAAKEVPGLLRKKSGGREISVYTVQNILANIYAKIHLNKANELSAWWFTHVHGVDSSLAPLPELRKRLLGFALFIIILPQIAAADLDQSVWTARTRTSRTEHVVRARRRDDKS
jgi:DNA-binding CsgD family transcriptional regulator